jgi:hypothetical protein
MSKALRPRSMISRLAIMACALLKADFTTNAGL